MYYKRVLSTSHLLAVCLSCKQWYLKTPRPYHFHVLLCHLCHVYQQGHPHCFPGERDVRKPPSCYICMVDILASNLPRDNVSARSNTSRVNCWRSHASRIFLFFPSICCLDFRTFIKASERTLASF